MWARLGSLTPLMHLRITGVFHKACLAPISLTPAPHPWVCWCHLPWHQASHSLRGRCGGHTPEECGSNPAGGDLIQTLCFSMCCPVFTVHMGFEIVLGQVRLALLTLELTKAEPELPGHVGKPLVGTSIGRRTATPWPLRLLAELLMS